MSVLITGATGVVGNVTLPLLGDVICLSRRDNPDPRFIVGDITRPRLGVDARTYRRLVDEVTTIVHIAGEVSFNENAEHYHDINVAGTANVTELCTAAHARIVYVSTAYAARADRPDFTDRGTGPSSYTASKRQAERLIEALGSEATIVRPSIVIGDSRTGKILQHQGIHHFAKNVMLSRLPFVPAEASWLLDMIPVDYLAAVIVDSIDHWNGGSLVWATAGSGAMTARDVVETSLRASATPTIDLPRFINPEAFDRLIRPAFFSDIPSAYHRRLDKLVATCDQLFSASEHFPSDMPSRHPNENWSATISDAWSANAASLALELHHSTALV